MKLSLAVLAAMAMAVSALLSLEAKASENGLDSLSRNKTIVPVAPPMSVMTGSFSGEDLDNFKNPEKLYYPESWFHMIGGNITREGLTADLEAIAEAGFSGIHLFHGQFRGGPWPGLDHQVKFMDDEWNELIHHIGLECERLGLRLTMQGCPGWSTAGGPWNTPEQGMRDIVYSRTDIHSSGNQGVTEILLPKPQPSEEEWRDYRDIAVLAFPTPEGDTGKPLEITNIRSDVQYDDWQGLFSGTAKLPLKLAPSGGKSHWIEFTVADGLPVTNREAELDGAESAGPYRKPASAEEEAAGSGTPVIRSVVFDPVTTVSGSNYRLLGATVRLEAFFADGSAETIMENRIPRSGWQDDKTLTFACDEKPGAVGYRISFYNDNEMTLKSLRFLSSARKNSWESEASWTLRSFAESPKEIVSSPEAVLHQGEAIDLSGYMDADEKLLWDAPEGDWTILRFGHVHAGKKNGPAPPAGVGWECDKFSVEAVNNHFDHWLGKVTEPGGPLADGLLKGILFDSWECRTQTWTQEMETEFIKRNGYELRPWLPALMGYVVESQEHTAKFLEDWRWTLNDLFVNNFWKVISGRARERGLSVTYETAAGTAFPADDLEYYKFADVPMTEFWQPLDKNYETSLFSKALAVSAARLYGKTRTAAEAFTSYDHSWDESFLTLKEISNIYYAVGITHFDFHSCTHNPQVDFLPPGTSFSGRGIGTPFIRNQTWWKFLPEFTDYLARCSYMLERGLPVSDILWFTGERIDMSPYPSEPIPEGLHFDYCNRDVLLNRLSVSDGKLVTPEGIQYPVLWVPDRNGLSQETAAKIKAFEEAGVRVVTKLSSLGIEPDLSCVSAEPPDQPERPLPTNPFSDAESLNWPVQPEVAEPLRWSHRRAEGADWYFVAAPVGSGFEGTVSLRKTAAKAQIWNPMDGSSAEVPFTAEEGRTMVDISIPRAGSCFIILYDSADSKVYKETAPLSAEADLYANAHSSSIAIDGSWDISFEPGWDAPASLSIGSLVSWKDMNISDEGKAYSGTAAYSKTFKIKKLKKDAMYILNLGDVRQLAEVSVNGKQAGKLWVAPYEIDITGFLRKGKNSLEIKVTNTWFNRLVHDAGQPADKRKTWVLNWPDKDTPLRDSGLLGPVVINIETND